jgi:V/A-type H+-transporting ATPase subunit E
MALQDLLASLERDARAEADALLTDARARAAGLQADADARMELRRRDTLEIAERAHRATGELAVAQASRAARARVLEARARAIEHVFAAVTAELPAAIASPAYLQSLPLRLAAARACLGDTPAAVRCSPSLLPALRAIAGTPPLAVTTDGALGPGFVLAACDGSLDVDETLTTQLARRRPQLVIEVVRALDEAEA